MEAKIETLSFTLENQPEFQRVITFLLNEHFVKKTSRAATEPVNRSISPERQIK
ncbi:hypothetical protein Bca4012_051928 [Brassica carinata]